MSKRGQYVTDQLHERIRDDAGYGVAMFIAQHADTEQVKWLATRRDSMARDVVNQLLRHYTIRVRRPRRPRKPGGGP